MLLLTVYAAQCHVVPLFLLISLPLPQPSQWTMLSGN